MFLANRRFLGTIVAFATMIGLGYADQAVVVGIQNYSPLVAASTLKGCVSDATSVAEALKKDGFAVTLLVNDKATKGGILGTLKQLETKSTAKQRFVFYYAGHGRKAPRYALMPSDATFAGNDISPKELNDAIVRIPARSRTVILDSCFSGGMAAGEMSRGLGDDFTGRFFDPESERSIKFGPPPDKASKKDTTESLETNSGICYYTAAMSSEQALEATMPDGSRHGLFTYALLSNLKEGKLWGEVHSGVKTTIGKRLENTGRTQNPMISTQYMGAEALTNVPKAGKKLPPVKTLLDVWNEDNPKGGKVSLMLNPDRDVLEAGRLLSLDIQIGQEGFLVVFGQVGDHFYQFYPSSTNAKDAAVKPGTIHFPDARSRLFFDEFGADHLKAMLFSSAEGAQSVLDAMQASQGESKDLILARTIEEPAFTSRVSISVGDALVGGLRLRDIDGLYRKVMVQDNDLAKFLVSRMRLAGEGYDKGLSWLADAPVGTPSMTDRQRFMTLLNLSIQGSVLYEERAFKNVRLPDDIRNSIKKPPTGEKLLALNRAILAILFPKEVNRDDARGR